MSLVQQSLPLPAGARVAAPQYHPRVTPGDRLPEPVAIQDQFGVPRPVFPCGSVQLTPFGVAVASNNDND